jgi:lambda repressor-like predicted transcriptional regulator
MLARHGSVAYRKASLQAGLSQNTVVNSLGKENPRPEAETIARFAKEMGHP